MQFPDLSIDKWFNLSLAKEPMNWAIVWIAASIWLLAFHVVMQGWGAMVSGGPSAFSAPGMLSGPPGGSAAFSALGASGATDAPDVLTPWLAGPQVNSYWTDGFESKYAEDGWIGP